MFTNSETEEIMQRNGSGPMVFKEMGDEQIKALNTAFKSLDVQDQVQQRKTCTPEQKAELEARDLALGQLNIDPAIFTTKLHLESDYIDVRDQPLKDTGKRQSFTTGAQRDCKTGKGAYHLLPYEPLFRYALTMQKGATKYDARNWEKGMPLSQFVDSAFRHLLRWMNGERDEDHLAQCFWNIGCLMQGIEWIRVGKWPAELNDIPNNFIKKELGGILAIGEGHQILDEIIGLSENLNLDMLGLHAK